MYVQIFVLELEHRNVYRSLLHRTLAFVKSDDLNGNEKCCTRWLVSKHLSSPGTSLSESELLTCATYGSEVNSRKPFQTHHLELTVSSLFLNNQIHPVAWDRAGVVTNSSSFNVYLSALRSQNIFS